MRWLCWRGILAYIVPQKIRLACEHEIAKYLEDLEDRVSKDVNADRGVSADRKAIQHRIAETYYGKNMRHLELGTFTAFPDERVVTLIKRTGIVRIYSAGCGPRT